MVTMRLLWMLDHVPGLRDAADRNEVMFGGVDTWILYKLTGKHVTEQVGVDVGLKRHDPGPRMPSKHL